jgi:hypothetical protein
MIQTITAALAAKQTITISYPPGMRTVEPHALGHSAGGDLLLRAFQTDGASASGEHKDWKLFRLDRAANVGGTGITFIGPRPGYKRGDSAMKNGIIAQL